MDTRPIYYKDGVDMRFIRPELQQYIPNIAQIFYHYTPEVFKFVITSGGEGRHSDRSFHYYGLAIDCRTWWIPPNEEDRVYLRMKTLNNIVGDIHELDGYLQAIIHRDSHLHIEYDHRC